MSSRTMLLGINLFVLVAIVTGGRESSVIFEDIPTKLIVDKIALINQTIQRQNNVQHAQQHNNDQHAQQQNSIQPIKGPVPLQAYSHSASFITPNSEIKKEVWILGLLNAALNIDKSLYSLNMQNPKPDHNIVMSPLCIAAAMALILLGSHGETKIEINKLFDFEVNTMLPEYSDYQNYKELGNLLNYFDKNNSSSGTQVNLAKAIFVQNYFNISKNYLLTATEDLHSELVTVNFKLNGQQAQQTINQWVSNKTNGKISHIMPDIPSPDTKTVITSALYFTGEWENPFFINYTRIKPFYIGPNSEGKTSRQSKDFVYVPMMIGNSDVLYHKNDELEFKAIGLPYKGNKFVTYFVLPNSNVSLRNVVSKMNGSSIRDITKNTKTTEFTYFVPKMTLESLTNLRPVLMNLGIHKIFNPLEADLSNMVTEPSYISDILHKVEIVINEVGTVASAATVVTITRGGQSTFNVNRPFLFFIHCIETDTIVFWSTVHKPTPYSTIAPIFHTHKTP